MNRGRQHRAEGHTGEEERGAFFHMWKNISAAATHPSTAAQGHGGPHLAVRDGPQGVGQCDGWRAAHRRLREPGAAFRCIATLLISSLLQPPPILCRRSNRTAGSQWLGVLFRTNEFRTNSAEPPGAVTTDTLCCSLHCFRPGWSDLFH